MAPPPARGREGEGTWREFRRKARVEMEYWKRRVLLMVCYLGLGFLICGSHLYGLGIK